ncbi:MAG TPA: hypothetical protein VN328_07165, partial [Thermodesulfovibrionales bacterium]|nr:hypothetical protein [Thermodesulfovibrionales bacterium]
DSPFMRFAERETAMFAVVKDASEAGGSTRREDGKGTVSQTGATQKKEEEVVAGISIATAQEDKAPQGLQIQEEVRTREVKEVASVIVSEDAKESVAQTSAIEKKEEVVAGVSIATAQEDKAPQGSQIQEEVRTTEVKQAAAAIVGEEAKESVEQTSAIEQEKEEVDVGISSPTAQEDKAPQDLQTQEEVKKTDGRQVAAVIIKGNRHAANEITELMKRVASVRIGAGIKGIPWQTGDAFGDFISEEVLYDEAKRSGVSADSEKLGELTRRYRLTAVESEVVGRYLAILSLVQMKIKNVSEGRMIETLTVQYTDAGNEDKISLAGRLQEQAREGKSFEEISKLYPGFAAYSVMKFQDLQDWLKNSVKGLRAGDVSVIWKGNGYMALKPLGTGSLFGMPTVDSDGGDAVKVFMKDWVEELGRDRAIEIIYD